VKSRPAEDKKGALEHGASMGCGEDGNGSATVFQERLFTNYCCSSPMGKTKEMGNPSVSFVIVRTRGFVV
jgi:hypothetical protein